MLFQAGFTISRLPLLNASHMTALGINMADREVLQRLITSITSDKLGSAPASPFTLPSLTLNTQASTSSSALSVSPPQKSSLRAQSPKGFN